jgi:hypothetical protein
MTKPEFFIDVADILIVPGSIASGLVSLNGTGNIEY